LCTVKIKSARLESAVCMFRIGLVACKRTHLDPVCLFAPTPVLLLLLLPWEGRRLQEAAEEVLGFALRECCLGLVQGRLKLCPLSGRLGGPSNDGELECRTNGVAPVVLKERVNALHPHVALSVAPAVGRMDLWVGPQVPHPLQVTHKDLVFALLPSKVAESLRLYQGSDLME